MLQRLVLLLVLLALAPTAWAQETKSTDAATTPTLNRAEQHFIKRVAAFREENKQLDPNGRTIVFLGDSITEGFPLKELFPGLPVLNRGISSDRITAYPQDTIKRGIVNRMNESVFDCHPHAVFLLIGTNHMPRGEEPLGQLSADYRSLVLAMRERIPDLKVVIATLPPAGKAYTWGNTTKFNERAVPFNEMLREFAKEQNLPLIDLGKLLKDDDGLLREDFTGDGIHLKRPAYEIWAAEANKIIEHWDR